MRHPPMTATRTDTLLELTNDPPKNVMSDLMTSPDLTDTGAAGRHVERVETGATLWFTGLPSAGKSTIAHTLAGDLTAAGHRVQVLDGDNVRPHLSAELGFSRADRDTNVVRFGWVAQLLAGHGVIVLVPVIAPYAAARETVRAAHASAGVPYAEVYVSTSREVAEGRDVKGLYAKARAGELTGLTGVDDPYERPLSAELEIDTAQVDLGTSVQLAKALLSAIVDEDLR